MAFTDRRLHERRRLVAKLHLRQLTTREIGASLRQQGWAASQATIVRDLAYITAEWQRAAVMDLGSHKARLLAENQELRRVLWSKPALDAVALLRSMEHEAKLLGLYGWVPPVASIEDQIADLGLDSAEVLRQVEALLAGNPEQA